MKHQHKAIRSKSQDRGWTECVTPDQCAAHPHRQSAHGNIIQVDMCSCGAIRKTEINGTSRNRGQWER